MRKKVVICDKEKRYAERLSDYIAHKKEFSNSLHGVISMFDSVDEMISSLKGEMIYVLLIGSACYMEFCESDDRTSVNVNKLLILSDEKKLPDNVDDDYIFKYQAGYSIFGRLLTECFEYEAGKIIEDKDCATLIGVYSPINRALKTTFSIILSEVLSETTSVLYVNFEGYSGLCQLLSIDSSVNIADLMYDYSVNKDKYPKRFHGFISSYDSIGIIPPVESVSEIQCIAAKDLISMLNKLKENGVYKTIVIDVGDNVNGIIDILSICNVVYMPIRDDSVSLTKIELFNKSIEKYNNSGDLSEKIYRLEFPVFQCIDGSIQNLKYSDFGEYVRKQVNAKL